MPTLVRRIASTELLESRRLLAVQFYPSDFTELANPTPYEQYIVEWINQARKDPRGVGTRLPTMYSNEFPSLMSKNSNWNSVLELLSTTSNLQPLAINAKLQASANQHTSHLLNPLTPNFTYSNWENNEGTPYERMVQNGYPNPPIQGDFRNVANQYWGEGISWSAISDGTSSIARKKEAAGQLFTEQFTSLWTSGRLDRLDMLDPDFQEIGVSMNESERQTLNLSGASTLPEFVHLSTIDYATQQKRAFVTGVAMDDTDGDSQIAPRYDPGEGEGKVLITVHRLGVRADPIWATETSTSGGYSIPLLDGNYVIRADASWGTMFYKFSIQNRKNTKIDFIEGAQDDAQRNLLGTNYLEFYTKADVSEWLNYPDNGGGGKGGGGTPPTPPPSPGGGNGVFARIIDRTLVIEGTALNDTVSITRFEDTVILKYRNGLEGFDKSSFDYIAVKTYEGSDRIEIGRNLRHNYVESGPGDDTVVTSNGSDSLYGGPGRDILVGGDGDDLIVGGKHTDRLFGQIGNDRLYGQDGNDFLDGGAGRDKAFGGAHNDSIFGSNGNDCIYGDDGIDTLVGGNQRDLTLWKQGDSRIAVEVLIRHDE